MNVISTSNETKRAAPVADDMKGVSDSSISHLATSHFFMPSSSLLSSVARCVEVADGRNKREIEKSRETYSVDATGSSAFPKVSSSSSPLGGLESKVWREKTDDTSVGGLRSPSSFTFNTATSPTRMMASTIVEHGAASSVFPVCSGPSTSSPSLLINDLHKEKKVRNEELNVTVAVHDQQPTSCISDSSNSDRGDDREVDHSGNIVTQQSPRDTAVRALKRTCRDEKGTAKTWVEALGEPLPTDAAILTECRRSLKKVEEEHVAFPLALPHTSDLLPSSSLSVCLFPFTPSNTATEALELATEDGKNEENTTAMDHSHFFLGVVGGKLPLSSFSTSERSLQSSETTKESQKSVVDVQVSSSSDSCKGNDEVEAEAFQEVQPSLPPTSWEKTSWLVGGAIPVSHVTTPTFSTVVPTNTFEMNAILLEHTSTALSSAETVDSSMHKRRNSFSYDDSSPLDMTKRNRRDENRKRSTIQETDFVPEMDKVGLREMTCWTTTPFPIPAMTSGDAITIVEREETVWYSRRSAAVVEEVVKEKEEEISQAIFLERKTEETTRESNVTDRVEGGNPLPSSAITPPPEVVSSVSCHSLCSTVSQDAAPADKWIDGTHLLMCDECVDTFPSDTTRSVKEEKVVQEKLHSGGEGSTKTTPPAEKEHHSVRSSSPVFRSKKKEEEKNDCCAASNDTMHPAAFQSHPPPMNVSSSRSIHNEICGSSIGIPHNDGHHNSRRSSIAWTSPSSSSSSNTTTHSTSINSHEQEAEKMLETVTVLPVFPSQSAFVSSPQADSKVAEGVNSILLSQDAILIPATNVVACTTASKAVEEEGVELEARNHMLSVKSCSPNHLGNGTTAFFKKNRVVIQEEMPEKLAYDAFIKCEKFHHVNETAHSSCSSLVSQASMLSDNALGGYTKIETESQEGEENKVKRKGVNEKEVQMRFEGVPQSSPCVISAENLEKRQHSYEECNEGEADVDKAKRDKSEQKMNECTRSHFTFFRSKLVHPVHSQCYRSTGEGLTVLQELEQDTRKQLAESMMEYTLCITKRMECERDMLIRRMQLSTQESIFRRVLFIEKEEDHDFLCEKSALECVVGESLSAMEYSCSEAVREQKTVTFEKMGEGASPPLSFFATQEKVSQDKGERIKGNEWNAVDNGMHRNDAALLEEKLPLLLAPPILQSDLYTKIKPYEGQHLEQSMPSEGLNNNVEGEEQLERKTTYTVPYTTKQEVQGCATEWYTTVSMGEHEEDAHEKENYQMLVSAIHYDNTNEAVPSEVAIGEDLLCSIPFSSTCHRDRDNENSQREKKLFSSISSASADFSFGSSFRSFHSFATSPSHRSVTHLRRKNSLTDSLDTKLSDSGIMEERYSNDLEVFCSSIPSSLSSIASTIDALSERAGERDVNSETKSSDIKRVKESNDTGCHHTEMERRSSLAVMQDVTAATKEVTTWCPWIAEKSSLTEQLLYSEWVNDNGKTAVKNGQNTFRERSLNQFSVAAVPNVTCNLKTQNLPVKLLKCGRLPHDTSRRMSRRESRVKQKSFFSNAPASNFSSLALSHEARSLRAQSKDKGEKFSGEGGKSLASRATATGYHSMQTQRRAVEFEHYSPFLSKTFSSSSSASSSTLSSWISSYTSFSVKKSALKRYSDKDVYTFSALH